jgi:hypothetical protein
VRPVGHTLSEPESLSAMDPPGGSWKSVRNPHVGTVDKDPADEV